MWQTSQAGEAATGGLEPVGYAGGRGEVKRNAFLSTIKFNRFDYVAAVTSPGLDLYDPALQRPDNAACGVMADRMSEALFAGLKHDKTDEAYYARHRAAIDAVRSVWRKMDELEK
ncbi:hypothetical protein [Chromobacterium phragmitis]|uniref:hypothetical protein n=1 Tax=Chromobacterium phragmitis TaxID=2202141 RepID=UPI0011AE7079|nr:hypothetical protein [Chromobacterium phragmitis]